MYYFAYGSNMNQKQMKERCPKSTYIKKAYLNDYKLVYDGYSRIRQGAVTNIVQFKENTVWGGLFEISKDCLARLDRYEGYPESYDRKTVKITDDNSQTYNAIIYYREGREIGKPSDGYRRVMIEGAKNCSLPDDYIESNL